MNWKNWKSRERYREKRRQKRIVERYNDIHRLFFGLSLLTIAWVIVFSMVHQ